MAALAIVNMIFRGDGKNNIVEANCFSKFLTRHVVSGNATAQYQNAPPKKGDEPVSRVFMNPPFALKKTDEREWSFVEAAMKSMTDGGLLFAIVPMSVVTESGTAGAWRKPLLAEHTVIAVVSFPEELFYPVANQTVAVILRKGVPHPKNQPVLWARIVNDGYRKSKSKRLPVAGPNDLTRLSPVLRAFIANPSLPISSQPMMLKAAKFDFTDPILEIAPEAYLDSAVPTASELQGRLDQQVRDNIAALVGLDLRSKTIGANAIINAAVGSRPSPTPFPTPYPKFAEFNLDKLFTLCAGEFHSLTDLGDGDIPVASCADNNNGIAGMFDVPIANVFSDAITIAFNGSPLTTKMHPYEFGAKDDVATAIAKDDLPPEALIFIQAQINSERWRFSYYRKCFRDKLGRTLVELPVTKAGDLDVGFMIAAVRAQPYWWFLAPRLKSWKSKAPATTAMAPL